MTNLGFLAVFLTLSVTTLIQAITIEDCPPGLHRDKYLQVRGNKCYVFFTYKSNDHEHALTDCKTHKGILATVDDSATQAYLYSMLRNTYKESEPVWIGLTDENDEGEWEWSDGHKATYTNWASGQPGIGSSLEDCGAINMDDGGKWHDYRCNDLLFIGFDHPYVCEYDPIVKDPPATTKPPTTVTRTTMTTTPTTTPPSTMTTTTTPTTTDTTMSAEKTTPMMTSDTTVTMSTTTTPPTTTMPTTIPPTTVTTPPPTTTTTTTIVDTTPPTTTAPATTTTPPTTTPTTTVPTTTTTVTTPASTITTAQIASSISPAGTAAATCPPFVCPNLSCGLDGYKLGADGCTLCECDF